MQMKETIVKTEEIQTLMAFLMRMNIQTVSVKIIVKTAISTASLIAKMMIFEHLQIPRNMASSNSRNFGKYGMMTSTSGSPVSTNALAKSST